MKIIIHTGVNARTLDYASFMAAVAIGLADQPKRVTYKFHTIPDVAKGSSGHSDWLKPALAECDPTLYDKPVVHVIADADTVLLQPGWDDVLHKLFLDEDVSCFGASYEQVGGKTSGDGPIQTYKDRPNLTWLALNPFMGWSDFDPSPNKQSNLAVDTWHQSMVYGLPVGTFVLRDVGWQLPGYLHGKGLLRAARAMRHEKADPEVVPSNIIDYSEEFHWNGVPFLAHQRGSGNREFMKDALSKQFYDACSNHILTLLGEIPRLPE
jgi:hypothetical protein